MSWSRWNWLVDGLLPLLLSLLRACWLWPCLELARHWLAPSQANSLLPLAWLVIFPLASLTLARQIPTGATPAGQIPVQARLTIILSGFGAMLVGLWWHYYRSQYGLFDVGWLGTLGDGLIHWPENEAPASLLAFIAMAYLWQRGALDARAPIRHSQVWGAFAAGLPVLSGYALVVTAGGIPPGQAMIPILLFFAIGMATLALASLGMADSLDLGYGFGRRPSPTPRRLSGDWLLTVMSVVILLLGLGLLLGTLVAPEDLATALHWVQLGLAAVGQLVAAILTFIAYGLFAVVYFLYLLLRPLMQWLSRWLPAPAPGKPPEMPETPALEEMAEQTATVPDPLRWAMLAVLLGAVAVLFALALKRFQAGTREEGEETRESILSADLIWDQLAGLWQSWLARLRPSPDGLADPFLPMVGEVATRQAIRDVYRSLLAAAKAKGRPRSRHETPAEYRRQLAEVWPGLAEPLDTITAGYIQARSAPHPPGEWDVASVEQAWSEVQEGWEQSEDTGEQS